MNSNKPSLLLLDTVSGQVSPAPVVPDPNARSTGFPRVSARSIGLRRLADGYTGDVVGFVVQIASSNYQDHGYKAPAIRGSVWARSNTCSIEQFERAANAAVNIARHELYTVGYLDQINPGYVRDWEKELFQAVVGEFMTGSLTSLDLRRASGEAFGG